jgi:2-deoxy-D-gluconate 3-dehydrogenase
VIHVDDAQRGGATRVLAGRVALVTGASEGIGRGLALGLARAGADVIVCSRRLELLEVVREEIRAVGRRAEARVLDVTDLGSIESARDFALGRFGRVDILVNDAGFSVNRPAWLLTEADFASVIDTNLKGVFFCSQIIGSIMRANGYGKIINLSSTVSRSVVPGASLYATVKAGVSHLTRALAVEWAPEGIRVNAIAPTSTMTPSRLQSMTPERQLALVSRIPLGRLGEIDDLVPAAVFLASSDSDFITGQTLFVDGGWTARG